MKKRPKRISWNDQEKIGISKRYWYFGPMDIEKMNEHEKKAFRTWKNQISRCYRESSVGYKHYGGKGIEVEYLAREFVGWYLENFPYSDPEKNWNIGRIDHDKNYRFDNIEFITKSDNSREMIYRAKPHLRSRIRKNIEIFKDGNSLGVFETIGQAAKFLGVSGPNVSRAVRGIYKQCGGYTFKLIKDYGTI